MPARFIDGMSPQSASHYPQLLMDRACVHTAHRSRPSGRPGHNKADAVLVNRQRWRGCDVRVFLIERCCRISHGWVGNYSARLREISQHPSQRSLSRDTGLCTGESSDCSCIRSTWKERRDLVILHSQGTGVERLQLRSDTLCCVHYLYAVMRAACGLIHTYGILDDWRLKKRR